ncbi:MAG: hypothetical protein QXL15_00900 [Candidatus Korarchaeota archaeon]
MVLSDAVEKVIISDDERIDALMADVVVEAIFRNDKKTKCIGDSTQG